MVLAGIFVFASNSYFDLIITLYDLRKKQPLFVVVPYSFLTHFRHIRRTCTITTWLTFLQVCWITLWCQGLLFYSLSQLWHDSSNPLSISFVHQYSACTTYIPAWTDAKRSELSQRAISRDHIQRWNPCPESRLVMMCLLSRGNPEKTVMTNLENKRKRGMSSWVIRVCMSKLWTWSFLELFSRCSIFVDQKQNPVNKPIRICQRRPSIPPLRRRHGFAVSAWLCWNRTSQRSTSDCPNLFPCLQLQPTLT